MRVRFFSRAKVYFYEGEVYFVYGNYRLTISAELDRDKYIIHCVVISENPYKMLNFILKNDTIEFVEFVGNEVRWYSDEKEHDLRVLEFDKDLKLLFYSDHFKVLIWNRSYFEIHADGEV